MAKNDTISSPLVGEDKGGGFLFSSPNSVVDHGIKPVE